MVTEKLEKLASSLDLDVKRVDLIDGYMFDGTTIFYSDFGGRGTEEAANSNLAHEIAHFLVASPDRRNVPDYGLGSGPESNKASLALKGTSKYQEEELASMLGMLIEKWAGQDPKKFTWDNHGWFADRKVINALIKLKSLGFVLATGKDLEIFESWEFYEHCCDQLRCVRSSNVCASLDEISSSVS